MNWHCLNEDELYKLNDSASQGLSVHEAAIRLEKYGANELIRKKKKPVWSLFLHQFSDFMILILLAAAIISGVMGDLTDTIIILIIVMLNAIIGFAQEYRAEKAMDALKKLATIQATVLRDNQSQKISSLHLVPGDIVLLEAGNVVPADVRLIETYSLQIDESALTGESVPAEKNNLVLTNEDSPVGDRFNMGYKGTLITNGRGVAIVVETGMNTQIGSIARMLQEDESITPLQRRMADFGKKLTYIILAICLILFVTGMLRGENIMDMLLLSISLAVAAIPEALPAMITIALARGAKRLVTQNVLIRKLPAVETLGSVSIICSDKTGTLTINKMTVVETKEAENLPVLSDNATPFLLALALNNDVKLNAEQHYTGDPTEIALVEYAKQNPNYTSVVLHFPRIAELPFDSDRKCMTTLHQFGKQVLVLTKGAVESLVIRLADPSVKPAILADADARGQQGLRVLAFAYTILDSIPEPFSYEEVEKNLQFAGLACMIDPPRPEVKTAIEECKMAGIHPVMITGDHPATAEAIARKIGLIDSEDILVVSGAQLKTMSEAEFLEKVEKISVYARVSPEQKMKIINALQLKKHFVAMTGDGVNDAPSLKTANIGIAMGINGTDVSKEASHMILLDDNFATIVKAVKEGRRIFDNIRKFIKYTMTSNAGEIWTIFLAPLVGLPIPLLPIHILWINLVTDGLPGLALVSEPAEKNVMQLPPRKPNESIFSQGLGWHIFWVGLLMGAVCLGIQSWAMHVNDPKWQTYVFTVLCFSQMGHVYSIRSQHSYLFQQGFFSNRALAGAVLLTSLLQLAVIYLPFANDIFRTKPLSLQELGICIGLSFIVFHAVEFEKWIKKRIRENQTK